MSPRILQLFSVLALFCAATSSAQGICQLGDTKRACIERHESRIVSTARTASAVESTRVQAQERAAAASTGAANTTTAVPTSSFTDFFNTLQVAVADQPDESDSEAMGFQLNHCGVPELPGRRLGCQLRARLQQPELHPDLKSALAAADLSDRATTLEEGLDLTDQVTVGLFFTPLTDHWGRDLNATTNALLNGLMNEADELQGGALASARQALHSFSGEYALFLQELAQSDPAVMQMVNQGTLLAESFTFDQLPAEHQQRALQRFEQLANAAVSYTFERAEALKNIGYFELANLMNNQPQLYAGVEYGTAADLVGPDEVRAKISYERGWANINTFRRYREDSCRNADGQKEASLGICLQRYLSDPRVKSVLESGSRVAVTLEYVKRKRFHATVPDTSVVVDVPSSKSLIGSLAYGWYLDALGGREQATRIDVVASYEDVSDDPARDDRGIASATLSRQVAPDWVLNFGLVYATEPEYRAAADKDLSLRLGLNYKLLRNPTK